MPRIDYLAYFVANVAPRAAMFCLLLILTRVLPIDDYGRFVLVTTTGEFFDMTIGGWVRIFALRSESAIGYLRPLRFGRILALTAVMTVLSILGAAATATTQSHALAFALSVVAYVLSFAFLRLALAILQIRRMHSVFAAIETLRAVAALGLTSLATVAIGPTFLNASLGLAAATCLAGLLGLFFAVRGGERPRLARTGYGAALAYGLPIALTAVLYYSIGLIDRFAVDVMIGPQAVAVLAAAYAFSRQPIDIFLGPLNTYTFPRLVKTYEESGAAATAEVQSGLLVTSSMIGAGISAAIILLAAPLLTTFLPPDYRHEGIRIVPWLTIGAFFLTAKVFIFDNVFHLTRKTWILPLAMLAPALLGLVLCIVLIPMAGLVGAGVSFAVAGFASWAVSASLAMRTIRLRVPWGHFLRMFSALAAASFCLVAVRSYLASASPMIVLIGAGSAFAVVYAGILAALGLSVRHALVTPWSPTGPRRKSSALDPVVSQP